MRMVAVALRRQPLPAPLRGGVRGGVNPRRFTRRRPCLPPRPRRRRRSGRTSGRRRGCYRRASCAAEWLLRAWRAGYILSCSYSFCFWGRFAQNYKKIFFKIIRPAARNILSTYNCHVIDHIICSAWTS